MSDDVTRRPWWRWMPGMLDDCGVRVVGVDGPWAMVTSGVHGADVYMALASSLRPNMADPATLGCLMALARELWGDRQAHLLTTHGQEGSLWWALASGRSDYLGPSCPSEWSALVAACDTAWGRR